MNEIIFYQMLMWLIWQRPRQHTGLRFLLTNRDEFKHGAQYFNSIGLFSFLRSVWGQRDLFVVALAKDSIVDACI